MMVSPLLTPMPRPSFPACNPNVVSLSWALTQIPVLSALKSMHLSLFLKLTPPPFSSTFKPKSNFGVFTPICPPVFETPTLMANLLLSEKTLFFCFFASVFSFPWNVLDTCPLLDIMVDCCSEMLTSLLMSTPNLKLLLVMFPSIANLWLSYLITSIRFVPEILFAKSSMLSFAWIIAPVKFSSSTLKSVFDILFLMLKPDDWRTDFVISFSLAYSNFDG